MSTLGKCFLVALIYATLAEDFKLKHQPASKPVRLFTEEELTRYDGSQVNERHFHRSPSDDLKKEVFFKTNKEKITTPYVHTGFTGIFISCVFYSFFLSTITLGVIYKYIYTINILYG